MGKKKNILVVAAIFLGLAVTCVVPTVWSCVGRKLTIGYLSDSIEQKIIAEMLAILIAERTGTKVDFKEFEDSMEVHRAIGKNEVQIYVEYTGIGLEEILGKKATDNDPKKVYQQVKKAYKKNFDLIWLKTLGYAVEGDGHANALPMEAAPVVRKDTLKKFPALARLLNQLYGRIDNNSIQQLATKVEKGGKTPKQAASELLGKLGISFSFVAGQA